MALESQSSRCQQVQVWWDTTCTSYILEDRKLALSLAQIIHSSPMSNLPPLLSQGAKMQRTWNKHKIPISNTIWENLQPPWEKGKERVLREQQGYPASPKPVVTQQRSLMSQVTRQTWEGWGSPCYLSTETVSLPVWFVVLTGLILPTLFSTLTHITQIHRQCTQNPVRFCGRRVSLFCLIAQNHFSVSHHCPFIGDHLWEDIWTLFRFMVGERKVLVVPRKPREGEDGALGTADQAHSRHSCSDNESPNILFIYE